MNKRKRAELVADALDAFTAGAIAPAPRLCLVPPVSVSPPPAPAPAPAPVELASEAFARLSLALVRARFAGRITSAELEAFTARVEAGEIDQVADELAARTGEQPVPVVSDRTFPTVAENDAIGAPTSDVSGVGGYPDTPLPAPVRVPTGTRGSSWTAPADDDAEAAEACRAWLRDYHAELTAEQPAPPASNAPSERWAPAPDFDVLGAELALGDWRPSRMGALLDGALASLRQKVQE